MIIQEFHSVFPFAPFCLVRRSKKEKSSGKTAERLETLREM